MITVLHFYQGGITVGYIGEGGLKITKIDYVILEQPLTLNILTALDPSPIRIFVRSRITQIEIQPITQEWKVRYSCVSGVWSGTIRGVM